MLPGEGRQVRHHRALLGAHGAPALPGKRPHVENGLHHAVHHGLRRLGHARQHVLAALHVGAHAVQLAVERAAAHDARLAHTVVVERLGDEGHAPCPLHQLVGGVDVLVLLPHGEANAAPQLAGEELVPGVVLQLVVVHEQHQGRAGVERLGGLHAAGPPNLARGVVELVEVAHRHLGVLAQGRLKQRGEHARVHRVVGVHEADPLPARHVEPGVAGVGQPPVGLVDDPHAPVAGRELVADGGAAVGRAVVHQDDLEVLVGLREDGLHARPQVRLHLVYGHDHRDEGGGGRLVHGSCLPALSTSDARLVSRAAALSHAGAHGKRKPRRVAVKPAG